MHRCTGPEERYYWQNRCGNRISDCPNGEDESKNNSKCSLAAKTTAVPTTASTTAPTGPCAVLLRKGGCKGGKRLALDRLNDRAYSVNECRAICANNSQCVTFSVGVRNGKKRCMTYKAG